MVPHKAYYKDVGMRLPQQAACVVGVSSPSEPFGIITYKGNFQFSGINPCLLWQYINSCLYPNFQSFKNFVSNTFRIYRGVLCLLIFFSSHIFLSLHSLYEVLN